jgi:hypothetical protein
MRHTLNLAGMMARIKLNHKRLWLYGAKILIDSQKSVMIADCIRESCGTIYFPSSQAVPPAAGYLSGGNVG